MKRSSLTLLLVFFCLASVASPEVPPAPTEFSFCSGIVGATVPGSLYQVPLTEEIIKASRPGFEDLRIFDAAKKEVPFVVIGNAPPHETIENYPLEITGYDREGAAAVVVMESVTGQNCVPRSNEPRAHGRSLKSSGHSHAAASSAERLRLSIELNNTNPRAAR